MGRIEKLYSRHVPLSTQISNHCSNLIFAIETSHRGHVWGYLINYLKSFIQICYLLPRTGDTHLESVFGVQDLKINPNKCLLYCVNNKRHTEPNVKSIIHETFDFLSSNNVRGERNLTLYENDSYSQATINVYHYRHVAYIFCIQYHS